MRAGRNLGAMRVLLAIAAALLPSGAAFRKLSILVFEGRLLIEYHADRPGAAENLLFGSMRKKTLTFWAVSTYVARVVETGRARRLDDLLQSPDLSPGAAALLQAAAERRKQGRAQVRDGAAPPGPGDHLRLAEDGLAFLRAEPDHVDLTLVISTALSAEACDREDLFSAAVSILVAMIDRIESDRDLSRAHVADMVTAKLTLYDVEGAQRFLANRFVAGMPKAAKLAAELRSIADETDAYRHVLHQAHEDMLARAEDRRKPIGELPVILVPAAAFRRNKIDYPGFRADIRFVVAAIVKALETHRVPFVVRSRLRTHGVIDLPSPSFSYHTISNSDMSLHFKETDRPSLFSFDRRGYAGWSEFSETALARLEAQQIPLDDADRFFELEKQRVIGGNLSKYRQADVTDAEELPDRFIFVALQLIGDAVSQLAYLNLFEMVDEVVETAAVHGLSVVVKRHPLCTSPEVSQYLAELASRGAIRQVFSSIHAIIPKADAVCVVNSGVGAEALLHEKPVYVFGRADYMAGCFVCRKRGDFADQFVPGRSRLSADDLRTFWYSLRQRYAADLRDRERAAIEIETRVIAHLREQGIRQGAPQ